MSKTFFNSNLNFRIRILNTIFRRSCWVCIILNLTLPALAQNDRANLDNATFPEKFRIEVVANNLRVPWSTAFTPDGRTFFTERIGLVRVIENGHLIEEPFLKLEVSQGVKMGLLGMALDPDSSIPDDNQYVNNFSMLTTHYWSYGHRNSQGFDFQPVSGQLLASEHEPNGGDEINIILPENNSGMT